MSAGPKIDCDGTAHFLPGTGGIVFNAKIGGGACGWVGDHIEPGVSTKNRDEKFNAAYNINSCIGNEAKVVSGDAKGAKGFVTGKHGGIENVMVYFEDSVLEKLNHDDRILIKAWGQGMVLTDYPDIALRNVSPTLLDKMDIVASGDILKVGVAKIVPAKIMGSGLGHWPTHRGDYDITMFDKASVAEYGLGDLRFGDIVAITDADNRFGRNYLQGAVSIGIVTHSDSIMPGHGPGVTTLMSALDGKIVPFINPRANLADMFL